MWANTDIFTPLFVCLYSLMFNIYSFIYIYCDLLCTVDILYYYMSGTDTFSLKVVFSYINACSQSAILNNKNHDLSLYKQRNLFEQPTFSIKLSLTEMLFPIRMIPFVCTVLRNTLIASF